MLEEVRGCRSQEGREGKGSTIYEAQYISTMGSSYSPGNKVVCPREPKVAKSPHEILLDCISIFHVN